MTNREQPDEVGRLGDELRARVGGEFRRSAEDDERAAAKAQVRSRTLEHVAHELLSRGDTIAVSLAGERIVGVVEHARGDLMSVSTSHGGRVDVRLAPTTALRVVESAAVGGRSRDRWGAESFVARLRELELEAASVTIIATALDGPVTGIIAAVTPDHVALDEPSGHRWYLAIGGIAAVRPG